MMNNAFEHSYLQHIWLAVNIQDLSAPFRTFFDNWFAFKEGGPFLNRNSRPHWYNNPCPDKHGEALRRAHFISAAAAKTLSGLARGRLIKDHAIPVSTLRDLLFERQPAHTAAVGELLARYYRIGIITEEEDSRLSQMGLRSSMPQGWTPDDKPFARYESAGLVSQVTRDEGQLRTTPVPGRAGERRGAARDLPSLLSSPPLSRRIPGNS